MSRQRIIAETETHRADPKNLQPDREIRYQLSGNGRNRLEVKNAKDDEVYAWIRAYHKDGTFDTSEIYGKQAERVHDADGAPVATWRLVEASDPPSKDDVAADVPRTPEGWRRIGDCLLMACNREVHEFILKARAEQAAEREGRSLDSLNEMAAANGGIIPFRSFHTHPRNFYGQPNRDQATFERMLRDGKVPGMDPRQMPR